MSDLWGAAIPPVPQAPRPFGVQPVSAMTPYVQQVQQEEKKRISLLQPVKWIFDILSRGQYLTANVGEEIIKSVRTGEPLGQAARDAINGALEGITGKRKGTWQSVLWGGEVDKGEEDYKFEGLFPEANVPTWAKKVIGFAADVILDPTTYISFGGTSAAKAGAKQYATNAVEVFLKRMQDASTLQKGVSKGVGREASKVYSRAYREALRTISEGGQSGGEILAKNLTGSLEESVDPLIKKIAKFEKRYHDTYIKSDKWNKMMRTFDALKDTYAKVKTPVQYGAPGERAMKLGPFGIGKELFKGERYPAPLKLWDAVRNSFENSPVGSRVADAWYAVNNTGVLGAVRKILGIRDPFGKYINELKVDSVKTWESASNAMKKQTFDVVSKIAPEVQEQARDVIWLADMITKGTSGKDRVMVTAETLLKNDPMANVALLGKIKRRDLRELADQFMKKSLLEIKDPEAVAQAVGGIQGMLKQWAEIDAKAATMGVIDSFDQKLNYLPNVYTDLPKSQIGGRQKIRGMQAYGQEREYLKWLFNVDAAEAQKMIDEKGAGVLMTNLEDMLMYRAETQARIMARIGIFEDFKKFGIPEAEINNKLLKERMGRTAMEGLRPVEGRMFQGMLFPNEVADILEKVNVYTKDPGLKAIRKLWNSFTGWWKGFATISTGFHVRNGIQNELNGWMKHGMSWFNPNTKAEAIAATIYALAKDNPRPLLEKAVMDSATYQRLLAKRVGPLSIQELADVANQRVLSRTTLGFDVEGFQTAAKGFNARQLNPMSREFAGMRGSRIVGEYLENSAKMQSFLMDYRAAIGEGAEGLEGKMSKYLDLETLKGTGRYKDYDYAIQWAKDETRKWFFEYDDLCFDSDTQLLTNEGWKNINEISYTQKALTFSIEHECLEWQPITFIYKNGRNGEMIHLSNNGMDALVTPRHKWVKIGGNQGGHHSIKKPKYQLLPTNEIINRDVRLKLTCDSFSGSEQVFTDDFVELCGWVVSEGTYIRNGSGIVVSQSKTHNPSYCKRIAGLAERMSGEGTMHIYENFKNKKDTMFLYIGRGIDKKIRDWLPNKTLNMGFLRNLTRGQLELLYKTLIDGDGNRKRYASGGVHAVFTQKNPDTVAAFQALCMMIGRRTVARRKNGIYYVGVYAKENAAYMTVINKSVEMYRGMVWCIHTPNNTVIARRNGTVYISGNTEVEKKLFRNVIPFYSWIRKNIPHQLAVIFTDPSIYSILPKGERALTGTEVDPALIPEWMRSSGAIPFAKDKEGKPVMWLPNLAYSDLNKIPLMFGEGGLFGSGIHVTGRELIDDIVGAAHPALKQIVQQIPEKGYDVFYRRDLDYNAKAPYLLRYFSKVPFMLEFMDGIARVLGREEGLGFVIDDEGQLRMNGKIAKLLEDNLPILRSMERVAYLGEEAIPGLDKAIEGATGAKDTHEGLERFLQLLSYWGGLKFKPLDLEKAKKDVAEDLYEKATEKRKKTEAYTPLAKKRSLQYEKASATKLRRVGL